MKPKRPLIDRLMEQVEVTDDCWLYRGSIGRNGYGTIGRGGRNGGSAYVHRAMWENHNGPIPAGRDICHTCDVRNCVRPGHLYAAPHSRNMQDAVERDRTSRGEMRWSAKLTEADIPVIRARVAGGASMSQVAREYKVSSSTIERVVHRIKWKHIA